MKTPLEKLLAAAVVALLTLAAARPDPAPQVGRYQLQLVPSSGLPVVLDTTSGQTWILHAQDSRAVWTALPTLGTSIPLISPSQIK